MGWSVGPIPFMAVMDYARAFEFSDEQTEDLVSHIRIMDRAYLKHVNRKSGGTSGGKLSGNS